MLEFAIALIVTSMAGFWCYQTCLMTNKGK